MLQSKAFQLWWAQYAPQLTPVEIIASFPFPWAPTIALSLLTKTQEEHRLTIARAARSANLPQIDSAVAAAYGWEPGQNNDEILKLLGDLNRRRTL